MNALVSSVIYILNSFDKRKTDFYKFKTEVLGTGQYGVVKYSLFALHLTETENQLLRKGRALNFLNLPRNSGSNRSSSKSFVRKGHKKRQ